MSTPQKITVQQRAALGLIRRSIGASGWANVSPVLWPIIAALPASFVELRPKGNAGTVRLTSAAEAILDFT